MALSDCDGGGKPEMHAVDGISARRWGELLISFYQSLPIFFVIVGSDIILIFAPSITV
jgi:hypothetical protein